MHAALRTALHAPSGVAGLDLDFVAGRYALNSPYRSNPADIPGWSFSRTGAGTGEQGGVIVPFASGVPRISRRGLLIEEAATNLWNYSDDFTNPVWGAAGTRVGGFPAPDGSNNAVEITMPNSTVTLLRQIVGVGVATGVSGRFFFRSAENFAWTFLVRNGTTATNLSSRAVNFTTNPSGTSNGWTVTPLADSWYAVEFSQTTGINAGDTVVVYYGNPGANQNGRVFRIWGGDFFQAPNPIAHISTGAAAGTRGVDASAQALALPAGSDFAAAGEFDLPATAGVLQTLAYFDDGGDSNRVFVRRNADQNLFLYVTVAGATTLVAFTAKPGARVVKWAFSRRGALYTFAVDGVVIGSATVAGMPNLTAVQIGAPRPLTVDFSNSYVRRLRALARTVSDAETQALAA